MPAKRKADSDLKSDESATKLKVDESATAKPDSKEEVAADVKSESKAVMSAATAAAFKVDVVAAALAGGTAAASSSSAAAAIPAAVTTAAAAPAVVDPQAALRARVTSDVIRTFSPCLQMHENERYFPTSAEELFKGSKQFMFERAAMKDGTNRTQTAGPNDLSTGFGKLKDSRLELHATLSTFPRGTPPVQRGDNKVIESPMYVCVRIPDDGSYVRLRYGFLYGLNGPQTCHSSLNNFDCIANSLAYHESDWEGCDIVLKPDLKTVMLVITESHGNPVHYLSSECEFVESTHVRLYSALSAHGIYNYTRPDKQVVLREYAGGVFKGIDFLSAKGAVWQPWKLPESARPFRLFGRLRANWDTDTIFGTETWTLFAGRMGTFRMNNFDNISDLSGNKFGFGNAVMGTIVSAAARAFAMSDSDKKSFPCRGLRLRPDGMAFVDSLPALAATLKPKIIRSSLGTVLTLDEKNSRVLVQPLKAGDTTQRWFVDKFRRDDTDVYRIINAGASELRLCVRPNDERKLTLAPRLAEDKWTLWTIAGKAIRPHADSNLNLNVLGGKGPNVGVWKWSGGDDNETWSIDDK